MLRKRIVYLEKGMNAEQKRTMVLDNEYYI